MITNNNSGPSNSSSNNNNNSNSTDCGVCRFRSNNPSVSIQLFCFHSVTIWVLLAFGLRDSTANLGFPTLQPNNPSLVPPTVHILHLLLLRSTPATLLTVPYCPLNSTHRSRQHVHRSLFCNLLCYGMLHIVLVYIHSHYTYSPYNLVAGPLLSCTLIIFIDSFCLAC